MLDRLLNDALGLLIPTVWAGFLWRHFRLTEITELNGTLVMRWRWIEIGLLIPVYAYYVVNFDATPLPLRITLALFELVAFSVWIYYCDKKMTQ